MRPVQREVCEHVIEGFLVQGDDIHVTSFVICVTSGTVEPLRFGKSAVKSGPLCNVVADIGMTNDTKFALRLI